MSKTLCIGGPLDGQLTDLNCYRIEAQEYEPFSIKKYLGEITPSDTFSKLVSYRLVKFREHDFQTWLYVDDRIKDGDILSHIFLKYAEMRSVLKQNRLIQ